MLRNGTYRSVSHHIALMNVWQQGLFTIKQKLQYRLLRHALVKILQNGALLQLHRHEHRLFTHTAHLTGSVRSVS